MRANTFRTVLMTLVVIVTTGCSYGLTDLIADAHKAVKEKANLPNFHKVHEYLYRSGEPTEKGYKELKDMGIATVIDLRGNKEEIAREANWAKDLGIKYINLPMSSQPPTKKQVDTLLDTIKDARDNKGGPVLVHCAHGSDRTGCMIGIWRVTQDGFDYNQTYQEMLKYWFTPKFTKLSGTVQQYYEQSSKTNKKAS